MMQKNKVSLKKSSINKGIRRTGLTENSPVVWGTERLYRQVVPTLPPIPFSSSTSRTSSRYQSSNKVNRNRCSRSDSLVSSDNSASWADSTENVIRLWTTSRTKFLEGRKTQTWKTWSLQHSQWLP